MFIWEEIISMCLLGKGNYRLTVREKTMGEYKVSRKTMAEYKTLITKFIRKHHQSFIVKTLEKLIIHQSRSIFTNSSSILYSILGAIYNLYLDSIASVRVS